MRVTSAVRKAAPSLPVPSLRQPVKLIGPADAGGTPYASELGRYLARSNLGELGVLVHGPSARLVGHCLDHWATNATPWSTFIRRYRESNRPVPTESGTTRLQRTARRPGTQISKTADTALAREAVAPTPA